MSKNIFALVKFGKREHLEQLRGRGLLYMKSLAAFRDLESDAARGDPFEGWDTVIQPRDIGEFTFKHPLVGQLVVPSELVGRVRIGLGRTASSNVFCMSAITGPIDGGFDQRLFEFPDTDSLIVVLNPSEFVRRASLAAKEQQLAGRCDF
ncbi:MAG TPA: hypothetical protein VFE08_13030 [Candidatus Sulfotelmatobacter sp.]|jgi:hypothetical protein|nr:hypothetical protein [Candidatus Sulfotelmatobacter sp.]